MSIDLLLSLIGIALTPFGWISTAILYRAARQDSRIGALTERTWIAAAIAIMLTSGALITVNRLTGYALFPIEIARVVFLVSLITIGLVPVAWVYLFLKRRLGA